MPHIAPRSNSPTTALIISLGTAHLPARNCSEPRHDCRHFRPDDGAGPGRGRRKSGSGDYKATPLAASSTWEAGGSSGSFTWSYPLRVPPAAAGPRPSLSISYDSGSVDGRTASTNNQGTAIGEGFDLTSSYIERKYGSCDDDGQTDKYDLCWKYDNASLVLNGKATELVKDDTTGEWRLKNDDASTVTRSTGRRQRRRQRRVLDRHHRRRHQVRLRPEQAGRRRTTERTNSVWTVPVFGDDSGEPGYADGHHLRRPGQDAGLAVEPRLRRGHPRQRHVVLVRRPRPTTTTRTATTPPARAYTRGGYLKEIRYGQRKDTLFTATPPPHKVAFAYAERCTAADCGCLTEGHRGQLAGRPLRRDLHRTATSATATSARPSSPASA